MSDAEDGEEIEAPPAPLKIMEAALDTQYVAPESGCLLQSTMLYRWDDLVSHHAGTTYLLGLRNSGASLLEHLQTHVL